MPHLTLEYSANIIDKPDFKNLFRDCHTALSATLPTDISGCKSRAIAHQDYYLGNGEATNAFIHVTLKIMPGRSREILDKVTQELLAIIERNFEKSIRELNLQITIEVSDLGFYLKKAT